ncbi:phenylalanyl-tRNA synthetase beta subunit [Nitrosomonas cryotolerans]|uniref:Phenylalanine--tRNA ligase beta subunit n=1 Tax=Nitrosomonas cryotolerans ATCC 49181 TaxID=1131553 RepID=A0A1N6IGS5_9PROT|nr:phenylalanine--tRNA ligase subunit beta [Nitrosomonas cryotolerans]SFP96326.1 phenylalanyl-tRNA synthetase beta subunit [Nitrosomonas cryotolerans]SIO31227.1 phenylalanyl-tRNA synthetase beta subunit [Nitrosomonas cryotolerans ATCC 49181]
MKFSENWLRNLVNPSYSSEELAHLLTMAGLEVEGIDSIVPAFDKVVVAEVLSVENHPAADRLKVCRVNVGGAEHESLQIVCGAPNVSAGVKVPCAVVGAKLSDILIKRTKLRGIESAGMLCSAKELGLSDETDGLLLLHSDAPVGEDFYKYYELDDHIFTLKLTPNRADCLSLFGIAREVAAVTSMDYVPLRVEPVQNDINDILTVDVAVPEVCPLYCGRVMHNIDCEVLTPLWIASRLERSGIRAINVVVDIINYVMLETGQPMHVFDLAKITSVIQVRYARSGESIQLLNNNKVNLKPDMLLIADENSPLALAGIMGGSNSSVVQGTTDIFLESAFFQPEAINGKSFDLGFSSDSAHRFERGVDFAATRNTLERATRLILAICGGKTGPITEVKSKLPQRLPVKVRIDRIKRILGIEIDNSQVAGLFERLKFKFSANGDIFHVTPPTYRFDLTIEEDFIEEIARIYGYDNIPASSPRANLDMLPASEMGRSVVQLKQIMAMRDYQEVINYAFVDAAWELDFANNKMPVVLENPIASQMNVMRSSLAGGLIANLQFNLNRKQTRVRLFEVGCCFLKDDDKDHVQMENIAGLCYGDIVPEQWGIQARSADFYDAKSDIEALFLPRRVDFEVISHPALHPGRSAQILLNDKNVGWIGELHPRWQKKYNIPKPAVLFELHLNALLTNILPVAKEISKFLPVRRDIAVLVDNHVSVRSLLKRMYAEELAIVSEIALFDIYHGKGTADGKKSLAFRILLQDTQKTLTDEEVDFVMTHLIRILEREFSAELRN